MPRASTKDRILAAGRDLIHRNGFSASGVAEITAAAGVPKGSFYNHFPSKEAFACEALESYWARGSAAMAPLDGIEPGAERVRGHFAAVDRFLSVNAYAAGCMLGNVAIEAGPISEELRAHAAALFDSWTDRLAAAIRAGQVDGSIGKAMPAATLARFLIGAWQGALQRAKLERDSRATTAFHDTLPILLKA
jgi:TetR/AcrR family transcriptional repressor of nem operon